MSLNAKARRRWFGALCLLGGSSMLVVGEMALPGRLSPAAFLCYWITCFSLTALSATVALLDAARVREESRREQRILFEETLRKIESEKRARSNNPR